MCVYVRTDEHGCLLSMHAQPRTRYSVCMSVVSALAWLHMAGKGVQGPGLISPSSCGLCASHLGVLARVGYVWYVCLSCVAMGTCLCVQGISCALLGVVDCMWVHAYGHVLLCKSAECMSRLYVCAGCVYPGMWHVGAVGWSWVRMSVSCACLCCL